MIMSLGFPGSPYSGSIGLVGKLDSSLRIEHIAAGLAVAMFAVARPSERQL
jgi:hypothetical protein